MTLEKGETTKKCSSCDKEISAKAKKCPYCQQDLRSWFRKHPILTFLGIMILLVVGLSSSSSKEGGKQTSTSKPTPTPERDFKASVDFTGSQFVISNLDELDCVNAKMEINGGILSGGYVLDGYTLEKGQTYTVGAMQFTEKDGTRFNPLNTKPKNFFISCRGNNDLNYASWYGEFK